MKKMSVLLVIVFALAGCSLQTTMEIRGVSRDEATLALCKQGAYRQICASPDNFDKSKIVIKDGSSWDIFPIFDTTHQKDTISIKEKGPNNIVISLKCESKTVPFNFLWGLLNPYERDIYKERSIMTETAEELYASNISFKWEGRWRKFIPLKKPKFGNSIWFAYEADSTDLILEYFNSHGYDESHDKTIQEWTFSRSLTSEPDNWLKSKRKISGGKWDSYEKIIVKQINADFSRSIIVVGIDATGVKANPNFLATSKNYDIGEELKYKLLDDLTKLLEEKSETTTFVSPSLWIKGIGMPAHEKNR